MSEKVQEIVQEVELMIIHARSPTLEPEVARSMELLTVEEVASTLRISRANAYSLCKRGILPCIRINKAVRVPKGALDKWMILNTNLPDELRDDQRA